MKDAKTLLLEFLAAVTHGQNAAVLFAEDGAVELPFLHSLGIPWRHRGRQAISELQRAQAALAHTQKAAARQLAEQALVRVADQLAGLAARQKTVIDETNRLEAQRFQAGRWTRGELRSLQANAGSESQLRDETARVADTLQNADVYVWVLRRAADEMNRTTERLNEKLTDAKTVSLATTAWTRIRDLVAGLKSENSEKTAPDDEESREQSQRQAADAIPLLAQIKLLKELQQDLLRRTTELDRERRDAAESSRSAIGAELSRLAGEQGQLAILTQRVVSQAASQAEPTRPKGRGAEK